MNPALYNLIVYILLTIKGTPRLDKKQNDIHDKIMFAGFILLFLLLIILGCAICFYIKPPEYYSTTLA